MSNSLEGGCLCKKIRYRLSGEPVFQLFCYCSDCRIFSGADGWAGYMVKTAEFELITGTPTVYNKTSIEGRSVGMNFCGTCGSKLFGTTEFGIVSVAASSLDDPSIFKPTKKVFTDNAPHWVRIPEYLEEM